MDTFISIFDQISYKPYLFVNNTDRYKTVVPSIIGFIVFSLILAISIFFFLLNISRKSPSILFNDMENYYPTLNFLNETLIVYLSTDINGDKSTYNSSLYSLKATQMRYARKIDENGNPLILDNNHTEINLVKCNENSIADYNILISNNTFCIPPENNVTLSGIYANEVHGYSYLNIFAIKCENITTYEMIDGKNTTIIKNKHDPNGDVCKSNSIIDSSIRSIYLNFGMKMGTFDHSNFTNPIIKKSTRYKMHLTRSIFKRHYLKLRNIIYETDIGMIFEEKIFHNGFVFSDIEVNLDIKLGAFDYPSCFGQMTFQSSNTSFYYKRYYQKMQSVIANIGGALNFLMTFGSLLVYLYTKNDFFLLLANRFFETKFTSKKASEIICKFNIKKNDKFNNYISSKQIDNNKKEEEFIKLNICQKLSPIDFNKDNVKLFNTVTNKIIEKISYVNIIESSFKIDCILNILLNDDQLNNINKSNKFFIDKGFDHIKEKDNENISSIKVLHESKLQNQSFDQNNFKNLNNSEKNREN